MATTDFSPPPLAVCDAGPLIHLDEIGCLDLLCDFSGILVPDAVWIEVERHRPGLLLRSDSLLNRTRPSTPELAEMRALREILTLHKGEVEALRLVLEHRPAQFLTDDMAARMAAASLGITTHGSIGLLVRAIRRKQRSKAQVVALLRSIPTRSSLHLKRSLLDAIILEVEQDA